MTEKELFRFNNFDLIRLLAALEVAIHHTLKHFDLTDHWLFHSTSWLPGVPIFFFVSGFLISRSYENNSRIAEYSRNRALRIYPALVLCTILAVISAFATGVSVYPVIFPQPFYRLDSRAVDRVPVLRPGLHARIRLRRPQRQPLDSHS